MEPPCVIFEDEHLLVVNKPAGLNTHAPDPFAGEGIYDWLRHREPRWAKLAIVHRLDKETSGALVFSKTPLANRSLTDQFTQRLVRKQYVLLTDRPVPNRELTARSNLVRAGERYASRAGGQPAETRFSPIGPDMLKFTEGPHRRTRIGIRNDLEAVAQAPLSPPRGEGAGERGPFVSEFTARSFNALLAEPLTGRTHQIRVHASERGFPILGDTLYEGTPAPRVFLHAFEIALNHPATGKEVVFCAPPDFVADPRLLLRTSLIDETKTNAWRVINGASDGRPGWYVERLGDFLLSSSETPLNGEQVQKLESLWQTLAARGAYHKLLNRRVRLIRPADASPRHELGEQAPERFVARENGLSFELTFHEGYSAGLFLDQRDNRRRLLTGYVAAGFDLYPPDRHDSCVEVLNTFAYTCGFSLAAAKAGAHTTSLDLSKKYLEWGKRNLVLNKIDPAQHDFIFGDVFDWLRRLVKRTRRFDVILLDPPTFSQSKASGAFRAEKDYGKLLDAALPLLAANGVLFASSNSGAWAPAQFVESISAAIRRAKRKIMHQHYVPQPPDFPISRVEPAYLKTLWLRLD